MSGLPTTTLTSKATDFINDAELNSLLDGPDSSTSRVHEVISKAMSKEPLTSAETAVLLRATDPELVEDIFAAARDLKQNVYGNRIVLFAPFYIGNECVNNCAYCAFRRSNQDVVRRTLSGEEIDRQVEAMENDGHKRLILVFGEHPSYDAEYIADCVRRVYSVRVGHGEIRRVNINAAPMDDDGYRLVKEAGIGTYQVFMETYHHEAYRRVHPQGTRKGDYLYRLDALSRAFEAGCDDVGIGALFGLHDWRFDVLGLVEHSNYLRARYDVGPHTISFPRLRPASGTELDPRWFVGDEEFKRLVAILRLAVPYTGMILTARESAEVRREVMAFGVSQIDAGSRIEIGGYTDRPTWSHGSDAQVVEREQFSLGDERSLDTVVRQLVEDGYIPSWCTACYRLGRTGEHFMEYAIPGFIQRFCTPNALTTLTEYLVDYASPSTRKAGLQAIKQTLSKMPDNASKSLLRKHIKQIHESDQRDLYV